MNPYQLLLLGADDGRRERLRALVSRRVTELGLSSAAVRFFNEDEVENRNVRAATMAVFFGAPENASDSAFIAGLLEESIIIAPFVSEAARARLELPPQLRHINALLESVDDGLERLASLVLETFRLLRRERKLFISYRRVDAQPLADLLYDALDARGFDVFIDVRSVPPAVDFQTELWHRMSDSDVVVLIDTPGFRESRWTTEELARANATNLQILHLLWPGQKEDAGSAFSHFVKLVRRDFLGMWPGRGRCIKRRALAKICDEAESLRARAIAARYRYLVDNFCDAARDLGMLPVVQPQQWILLKGACKGKDLAVVPAVGIPTSNRINEIFDAIGKITDNRCDIWVIYDNRGVLNTWLDHLDWLDKHLPLRAVRMARAPSLLHELLA